jgi:hypothetical protein
LLKRREKKRGRAEHRSFFNSNHLQRLQTRVAVPSDDNVIVHLYAERLRDLHDHPRHLDVGARGCRVAPGMVVHQDYGGPCLSEPDLAISWPTKTCSCHLSKRDR